MQDPIVQELNGLLALASDVKTRLRQLETASASEPGSARIEPGNLSRTRHHLDLAMEALGRPTWGFTSTPASSLEITGFYSSSIFDALRDLRNAKGKGVDKAGADDAMAEDESDGAEAPEATGDDSNSSSTWVKNRVDEIQRALSVAFGEDGEFGEPEQAPKPFSPPEFIGNTDTLAIPELIGFFQIQRKTGVLTIDAQFEQFTLEYLNGELIHACSSSSPPGERLGEILVQLGHITEDRLARLLAGKTAAERMGDALRRGEVIPENALAHALDVQVQRIFHRLFDLEGCRFTFREGLEGETSARVRYNVTRLLLETARHRDELHEQHARRAG